MSLRLFYDFVMIFLFSPPTETDSVGGKVEAGCAKCCSYCRFSPLGTAVCYSKMMMIKGGQTLIYYNPLLF